jgi:hypothetical protein
LPNLLLDVLLGARALPERLQADVDRDVAHAGLGLAAHAHRRKERRHLGDLADRGLHLGHQIGGAGERGTRRGLCHDLELAHVVVHHELHLGAGEQKPAGAEDRDADDHGHPPVAEAPAEEPLVPALEGAVDAAGLARVRALLERGGVRGEDAGAQHGGEGEGDEQETMMANVAVSPKVLQTPTSPPMKPPGGR